VFGTNEGRELKTFKPPQPEPEPQPPPGFFSRLFGKGDG
jgi:hypothetical protein